MAFNVRNLPDIAAKDPRLYEALQDVIKAVQTISEQSNTNPSGPPASPPAINGLKVTGQNGLFHVAITDQNQISRGITYFVEHSASPNFVDPQIVHIGTARNAVIPLGNATRYFRAYSSYSSSAPSAAVYHGSAARPIAVNGGGTSGGPAFLPSEGSGTGAQGQGLSGFGPTPKRAANGQ